MILYFPLDFLIYFLYRGTNTIIAEATIGNIALNVTGVPVATYRDSNHPQKNSHNSTIHTNLNITVPFICDNEKTDYSGTTKLTKTNDIAK